MEQNTILLEFGYSDVISGNEISDELSNLEVDAVHFSGEFPTIFFKEVADFSEENLRQIARIHKKIWNYSKVIFLFATSPVEIRIYNCNHLPFNFEAENVDISSEINKREITSCVKSDKKKLQELKQIFSSIAIDSGLIWTIENNYSGKISLQSKVDNFLVKSLLETANVLKEEGLTEDIIHSLLMRSLFIMYLQDKGAIPKELWNSIGQDDYLKILNDEEETYKLFDIIELHFNGNVFPLINDERSKVKKKHLEIIKNCLQDGEIERSQGRIFEWRIFDFNIIKIELLSEIYENFLNELDPKSKKREGQFYTPPVLVELILESILPVKNNTDYNLKILDPACGSGIFLVESFKRIVNRWINAHNRKPKFNELIDLLKNTIYGVELDKRAISVTAFSLYLALLDFLEPKNVWFSLSETKFPYLIWDIDNDRQGKNLFRMDTIAENGEFENNEYDIIVGNPPFGTKDLPENAFDYCEKHNFSKQFVIPFIHKAAYLAKNGKIALIFNTKLLTNTEKPAQNFRKWLFTENYIEKVYNLSILRNAPKNFGGKLFNSASVPVSIVFFQKDNPEDEVSTIEYWAPKTYIKSHSAEGIIINNTDVKYLPRSICQEPNSRIWKIAQWGTLMDYYLLRKLEQQPISLRSFIQDKKIKNGVGFQYLSDSKTIPKTNEYLKNLPLLQAESIERYYSGVSNLSTINKGLLNTRQKTQHYYLSLYGVKQFNDLPKIDKFRRLGALNAYRAPHMFLKKGLTDGDRICATLVDVECSFKDGVYGFYSEEKDENALKYLCAIYSSDFAHYFLFMFSSSYGIEREQIMKEEYLDLPFYKVDNKDYEFISNCYEKIINSKKSLLLNEILIKKVEKAINEHIYSKLNILNREAIIIEDMVKYSINLFHKGDASIAFMPIASENPETKKYAEMLCDEMNEHLTVGDLKTTAVVYKVSPYTPLSMVVLKFVNKNEKEEIKLLEADNDFQSYLKVINNYTLNKYSRNVYVQKQIRYYENDTIFIVKPNQKRFWTRSQGIDDAHSIIAEISTYK